MAKICSLRSCRTAAISSRNEHGDGIGFFASAAARHPDADRPVPWCAHQLRNDLLRQLLEGLGVAEEERDIDEQIVGEALEFGRVFDQQLEIAVGVLDAGQSHAPLDPAADRSILVKRKIMRSLVAQQIDDLCCSLAWLRPPLAALV